jgi:hypothetical protein
MRCALGFSLIIPLIFVLAIVMLAAFFWLLGLAGFLEFIAKNIRDYSGPIVLSVLTLPLLVMLANKRRVAVPLALVTGLAILIQQQELANVSAVLGMPAALFLVAEDFLSRTKRRGMPLQLLALVSVLIIGIFIGALLLWLRNRF